MPGEPPFKVDIIAEYNYYPFGMMQPGNYTESDQYRYAFNGKEKDDEMKGIGNSYDYGARMYDSRLGRWFKCDPNEKKYPSISTYSGFNNNPVLYIDPNGKDWENFSVTSDENGNKTIHIVFTAATLNSVHKCHDEIMSKFNDVTASQIKESYEISWTETVRAPEMDYFVNLPGEGGQPIMIKGYKEIKVSVKVEVNLRTISNKSELAENEHLIELLPPDQMYFSSTCENVPGEATKKGKHIRISSRLLYNILKGIEKQIIPHEVGETGGLEHPNDDGDQHMEDGTNNKNAMYPTDWYVKHGGKAGENNEILKHQILIIKENYENGELNQEKFIPEDEKAIPISQ